MAEVKAVCGSCGAAVLWGAERCASCGEGLAWPAGATRKCTVCGHLNLADAETCTACGARVGGKQAARSTRPVRTSRQQEKARETAGLRRFEPWQIISFVAVAALVAVLLYVELSRDHVPAGAPAAAVAPAVMPPLQGPPAENLEPLEAAAAADPKNPEALLALANALHDNGMFLRAVETYKKYLHLQPGNPDARVDMGVCYYELGRVDSVNRGRYFALAIGEMEAAFRSAPTHQPSAFNLGVVSLQSGDVEASNRWFRKTVELGATSELGVKAQRLLEQHSFNP